MISIKKILLIIFCVLCTVLILKKDKIINYFHEGKYYNSLIKWHILKKCYNPGDNFQEVFVQEGLNYQELNKQVIDDALDKLASKNSDSDNITKIPRITHKIYFTSSGNASLSEFYLQEMQINYAKLNTLDVWEHNIWTNRQTIIPDVIKNIKGIKIRLIEEFNDYPLYQILTNLIQKGQEKKPYLAQAADLFRLMVLQKFGGVYSDMDYEIYNSKKLLEFMNRFDFISGREHWAQNSYYGNAFIAAKPNHPILNEAITMSIRNYSQSNSSPDYIKYPCNGYDSLYFNGPPLITISYFKKSNIDGNSDIILPPWMIYNVSFIRSKNRTCDIKNITKDFLQEQEIRLDQLREGFVLSPEIIKGQQQDLLESSKISDNIYYNLKNRSNYEIIGADMFCGGWTENGKTLGKNYYWNILKWN